MRLPAPSPTGIRLLAGSSGRALVCAILLRCTWGRQCFALRTGGGSKGPWRKATVPVDSFAANPWGLYNVHGNGPRIVGTKRMSETRATARREPMEIAADGSRRWLRAAGVFCGPYTPAPGRRALLHPGR